MKSVTQTRVTNAKALKRMRASIRQKCSAIGIPMDTVYTERQHPAKMVRVPPSALNPSGYKSVVPVQRLLANCMRNELKSMKAIGGHLFAKTASGAR